jgi:hypothetical protein
VKLNASLKSLEQERDQVEGAKTLQNILKISRMNKSFYSLKINSLKLRIRSFAESLKNITELYEEKGMKFCRKLMVEDRYQQDRDKKLSKVEENISHTADELETYKKVARELKEKLERTNHYYQR